MKNMTTPPPVPSDLDVGDIVNVKVGDEVAVWHTHAGKMDLDSRVGKVTEIKDGLVRVGKLGHFYLKYGGAALYFMGYGGYFHSVNPEHIATAKALAIKEQEEERRKVEAREALMRKAYPIGEALGDGTQYDGDGQAFDSYTVAENLADKLTPEQLDTLAGWLGIVKKNA